MSRYTSRTTDLPTQAHVFLWRGSFRIKEREKKDEKRTKKKKEKREEKHETLQYEYLSHRLETCHLSHCL
jgi:hypothetical protein